MVDLKNNALVFLAAGFKQRRNLFRKRGDGTVALFVGSVNQRIGVIVDHTRDGHFIPGNHCQIFIQSEFLECGIIVCDPVVISGHSHIHPFSNNRPDAFCYSHSSIRVIGMHMRIDGDEIGCFHHFVYAESQFKWLILQYFNDFFIDRIFRPSRRINEVSTHRKFNLKCIFFWKNRILE